MNINAKFFDQANRDVSQAAENTSMAMTGSEGLSAKITIEVEGAETLVLNADQGFAVYVAKEGRFRGTSCGDIDFFTAAYKHVLDAAQALHEDENRQMMDRLLGGVS